MKIRGGIQKYILKTAVEDLLPNEIVHRKKMGFPTPMRQWLRDERAEPLYAALPDRNGFIASYLDLGAVDRLVERNRSGVEDCTDRLWRLINLQLWGDLFITGKREKWWQGILPAAQSSARGRLRPRMKLLWVKGDFLHPTTKGGQIRTLETLKRLHRWHEVHYVGLDFPPHPEAVARAHEYCSHVYPIPFAAPDKRSLRFGLELAKGLLDAWPVSISRYRSRGDGSERSPNWRARRSSTPIVCDFFSTSQNMPDLSAACCFNTTWKR